MVILLNQKYITINISKTLAKLFQEIIFILNKSRNVIKKGGKIPNLIQKFIHGVFCNTDQSTQNR